jgi:hypothetical protein
MRLVEHDRGGGVHDLVRVDSSVVVQKPGDERDETDSGMGTIV